MSGVCTLCGAIYCQHRRYHERQDIMSSFHRDRHHVHSLGEEVGERLSYSNDIDDLNDQLDRLNDDGNTLYDTNPLTVGPSPESTVVSPPKSTKSIIDISKDWVQCNLCPSRIFSPYLDQHMKGHIFAAETKSGSSASTTIQTTKPTSTSIVRVSETSRYGEDSWEGLYHGTSSSSSSTKKDKPTLQSREVYKYRPLNYVCAAGSVSRNGRYSDFTIIFWTDEVVSVQNNSYYGTGVSSTTFKDWERLQIHVVYDSLEDYYTVSCKLSRRGQYSSWDTDDSIPDRICYQDELMTEIKRAMLFFRVNPKAAYKLFRKMFNEELVIEYDADGKAVVVQTKNCEDLHKKLKGSTSSTHSYSSTNDDYRRMNGWHGFEGGYDV